MPIVTVENKRITFPDSMSRDEIKAALDKQFGQKNPNTIQPFKAFGKWVKACPLV